MQGVGPVAHPPNYKSELLPKQCLSAALRESDGTLTLVVQNYITLHKRVVHSLLLRLCDQFVKCAELQVPAFSPAHPP